MQAEVDAFDPKTKTATLDEQLQSNPYLQHPTVADFVTHRMDGKTPNTVLPIPGEWTPEGA